MTPRPVVARLDAVSVGIGAAVVITSIGLASVVGVGHGWADERSERIGVIRCSPTAIACIRSITDGGSAAR